MSKKVLAASSMIAVMAVLAASCTLPTPASHTWKVKPVSVKVIDQEDFDPGDEPYVIQLGFRSKLGVPNSSSVSIVSQCPWGLPATNVGTPGTVVPIPAGSADIVFPEAKNLNIGDVLLETAPLEIFGTISFVMERDVLTTGCGWKDLITNVLPPIMVDALNLLIGEQALPPTQEQLIDLLVDNLGSLLAAIPGFLGIALEGAFSSPDDLLGMAVQIHLPTAGAFTDLLNLGLTLAGLNNGEIPIPDLPATIKFRIGKLLPSSASFDFVGPGYESIYTSSVGT